LRCRAAPEGHDVRSWSTAVGMVDVIGIVKRHRSKWFSGPLGWRPRNPRPLSRPIRCVQFSRKRASSVHRDLLFSRPPVAFQTMTTSVRARDYIALGLTGRSQATGARAG
jgi:hypothetical protein